MATRRGRATSRDRTSRLSALLTRGTCRYQPMRDISPVRPGASLRSLFVDGHRQKAASGPACVRRNMQIRESGRINPVKSGLNLRPGHSGLSRASMPSQTWTHA